MAGGSKIIALKVYCNDQGKHQEIKFFYVSLLVMSKNTLLFVHFVPEIVLNWPPLMFTDTIKSISTFPSIASHLLSWWFHQLNFVLLVWRNTPSLEQLHCIQSLLCFSSFKWIQAKKLFKQEWKILNRLYAATVCKYSVLLHNESEHRHSFNYISFQEEKAYFYLDQENTTHKSHQLF